MNSWKTGRLGDFLDVKGGKRLPKGASLTNQKNTHPYIRVRDLGKCKILNLTDEYEYVDDITQKQIARYIVSAGDIVISIVGTIGLVGIVGKSLDNANLTENCVKLVNINGLDRNFLYYYLLSSFGQAEISRGTVGAVQQKLPIKNIQALNVHYPNISEQIKIGNLLSSIDEKIATNEHVNDNLADLLQTIYQERFDDAGLVANQGTLSDICSYSRDKVAVSKLNISTYFSTENMLSGKAGSTVATSLPTTARTTACHKGDTLVSSIRPYFKKIVYCEDECGCSTDVLCFTPDQPQYSAYLFSTLYVDKFFAFMVAGSKGTKMPRGDKQQIMTYPIVLPSEAALDEFNAVALPLIEQIYSNRAENKRLSLLRNTLLPKLMSGELDVSAIEI